MQASTRYRLQQNYDYHANLAEFHKQRAEAENGNGQGGESGGEGEGETQPTAPPEAVEGPYVSGNGAVGETLRCTTSNWSNYPDSYSFQWRRDDAEDIGEDQDTYTTTPEDVGHGISCLLTAFNSMGSGTAPMSNVVTVSNETLAPIPQQNAQAQGRTQRGERSVLSRDEYLAGLHAEAARQLRDVLDSDEPVPTPKEQRDARPVVRGQRTAQRRATLH